MTSSARLPAAYRLYRPVHNALSRAGTIVLADRHPALVARNRLSGLLYKRAFRAEGVTEVRTKDGFTIFVSPSDRGAAEILFERSYAPDETRVLVELFKRVERFVDVGANYGYFSLLASVSGGPELAIVAVEPNPSLAAIIGRSASANGFSNITVVTAAVGAQEGTAGFAVNEGFSAVSHITDGPGSMSVDVVTVDGLLAAQGSGSRRALIKIDVEGHEVAVLEGARRALDDGAIVTCEVFAYTAEAIMAQLKAHGYGVFRHSGARVTMDDWRRHKRLDVVCLPPGESLVDVTR